MNDKTTLHRIAVYGTLKRGFANHDFLAAASFIGTATLHGIALYDLGLFPGAKYTAKGCIEAEVYDVADETLASVDLLEGCNMGDPDSSFYYRHPCDSAYGPVWLYIYQPVVDEGSRIASGVW